MCTYVTVPKTGDTSGLSYLSVGGTIDRKNMPLPLTRLCLVRLGQMAWPYAGAPIITECFDSALQVKESEWSSRTSHSRVSYQRDYGIKPRNIHLQNSGQYFNIFVQSKLSTVVWNIGFFLHQKRSVTVKMCQKVFCNAGSLKDWTNALAGGKMLDESYCLLETTSLGGRTNR